MTESPAKPIIRIPAVSRARPGTATTDNYQNLAARTGVGTNNVSSEGTYGFNPVSRNRQLLEWMYRGSWIIGKAVDVVAEDMTRAGVDIASVMPPNEIAKMHAGARSLGVWDSMEDGIRWARLYGGAILVMLIDGQDVRTPLNPTAVGEGQFRGLLPLDRWMVQPSFSQVITDLGPDLGKPVFYDVTANAPAFQGQRIHHTRVIRLEGAKLPYWQSQTENLWGMSIVERLYDRLLAFDSTTQGAAQLVFKAYLRTYKVKGLRQILGGPAAAQKVLFEQIDTIRLYQSNEGLTLMDADDEMDAHQYSFGGLSDVMDKFGQQIAGATGIPQVRLYGETPAGFSSGESDLRQYYDTVNSQQNTMLRRPVLRILEMLCRSEIGKEPPAGFSFEFEPLWQLSDKEKSEIAKSVTETVTTAEAGGTIKRSTALKELRQQSDVTGVWSNITDDDIKEAEAEEAQAPDPEEVAPTAAPEPDADQPRRIDPLSPEADRVPVMPAAA